MRLFALCCVSGRFELHSCDRGVSARGQRTCFTICSRLPTSPFFALRFQFFQQFLGICFTQSMQFRTVATRSWVLKPPPRGIKKVGKGLARNAPNERVHEPGEDRGHISAKRNRLHLHVDSVVHFFQPPIIVHTPKIPMPLVSGKLRAIRLLGTPHLPHTHTTPTPPHTFTIAPRIS